MERPGAAAAAAPQAGYERLTADEMDERRRQNVAYQYLCHLEEAKRWMEACLKEPLASPTELEESLRNGVILAKLGHFFAPDMCPLGKIYDLDQARFKACGLHFRHTDNINWWRDAMSHIGLPTIFHPETTDIYDKKNMPRVVYCIHALSLYLFKLGLAPQIQDLYGKVKFTEEEINHMKRELEKYGLHLPSFSKIGGILANELSVDEAAVHAAVLAINQALEAGVTAQTVAALRNPNARLSGLREPLGAVYQEELLQAKVDKAQNAKNRRLRERRQDEDLYDRCLTQSEIQAHIHKANVKSALEMVDDALELLDAEGLCSALQDPSLALRNLRLENGYWYLEQLSADREQKSLEMGYVDLLEREEIQAGLYEANERGDRERAATEAVRHINAAIRRGVSEETARALADPAAQLPDIFFFAAGLYQRELSLLQKQHPQGALVQEELFVAIEMLSAVALVNQALEDRDARSFWRSLASPGLGLSDLEESNAQCYFEELLKLKEWLPPDPRTHFLSWNDIQASVRRANASVQEENEKIVAVRLINEALEHGSPEKTLTALLLPSAGLQDVVRLPVAKRYHEVLRQMLKQKARATEDTGAALWWEEIVEGVARANLDTEAAKRMALGVAAINQAIKEGNAAQTARVLCNPDVSLCGVAAECAEAYQAELGALMATRSKAGDPKKHWVQHRARDGMAYFFSLQTFEGSWEHPPRSALNTTHLGREEIQATIAKVTAALDRQRLWESSVGLVIRLQARMRGFLARQAFAARKHLLSEQVPAAIKIQACWRGYQQQRRYLERLGFLRRNTEATIKIQAWVRMWAARKRYLERLRYFRENVWAVIKIQAFVRANKARGDYKLLVHSRNPPLGVVRRFAHLLERSQQDSWEELELLEVQEGVVKGIRSNQQLEKDLGLMDVKIGLLVKNRITLQEVVSHCKKLTKRNKDQLSDLMGPGKDQGLKALSKDKRKTLEAYQHLFYQLQTHPVYLARLILQMPQNKSTKFMETVVFTLYNYASNSREAYLLLQLFRTALQEEIHSRVTQIRDVLTGNSTVIRMVVSFYRNARGQNALREILAGPIQDVLQNRALSIRTSPVEIYRGWINQTESQMGQKSPLPYDVTPEQALGHPEVQRRLDISLRHLLTVADTFLSAITSSVDKLPYGMRYIAKVLKSSLTEKFPQSPSGDIDKVVGNLLYYRFMNPAVVAPDGFDIVDFSAGVALHPDHRRNLGSVAKILQHAAAGQLFEGENGHLRGVNRYLEETHLRFREFIRAACLVPDPEERFDVDKYSDTIALTKPVVYITAEEIVNTHKLLLEHQGFVAPDPGDPLHELLEDLGGLPTVHMLIGEKAGPGASEQLAKGEISLTLDSKFDATVAKAEDRNDTSTLLLSTKQLLVDVIQSQPGDSLVEVLQTPASEDQEVVHQQLMKRRAQREAQAPARLRSHHPLAADTRLSLEEKKRKILKNLRPLESLGLVAAGNQYQEILNEMAQDICNQRRYRQRRKAELARLQRTLGGLHAKRRFHEEQVDFYRQYLRTCLDNLAARNRSSKKQAGLHYTGARLYEKGVLLGIDDLPVSQLKNVIFEIVPSEEAGEFQVQTKFMGIAMERFPLHYQELLQLQYEGVAVMKMFDKAKVNVNLLIFLLNKKFFKK